MSPRGGGGGGGSGQGGLLPGPKAAGRTLRRSQLPPDLRERAKSIETMKLADIFQQPQQQPQRMSVDPSPPPPPASSSPPPPPPSSGEFRADFTAAPVAVPAPGLRLASSSLCNGLRGAARADAQSFCLGEELAFRGEAVGFARDAAGAAHLVCRYHITGPDGRALLEGEHETRAVPALGGEAVEIGVAIPLLFEAAAAGPCQFRLSVTDAAVTAAASAVTAASVAVTHAFVLRGWCWGLRQARLLIEGRPLQVPAVFPFQELAVSAVVTLEAGADGAALEAFFAVRDVATGATLRAEPQPCQLLPHPRLSSCFALLASVAVARPGAYQLLLAVKHPAHPAELLRHDLQFAVVHFQS